MFGTVVGWKNGNWHSSVAESWGIIHVVRLIGKWEWASSSAWHFTIIVSSTLILIDRIYSVIPFVKTNACCWDPWNRKQIQCYPGRLETFYVLESALILWILIPWILIPSFPFDWASLVAQLAKNLRAMKKSWVRSLGQEDPLEKEMATHSSTLAWRTPWTEEPGRVHSIGSQGARHNWETNFHFHFSYLQDSCPLGY